MRGIHLITSILGDRYPWLKNSFRVRIVPNMIKRPTDDRARERLLEAEEKVRDAFPDLSRCFVPTYVRDSDIISSEARRHRFVAEQYVPNRSQLENVLDDFKNVATDLLSTFRMGFTSEAEKQATVIGTMRKNTKASLVGLWADLSALSKSEFRVELDRIFGGKATAQAPTRRKRKRARKLPKDDRPVTRIAFVLRENRQLSDADFQKALRRVLTERGYLTSEMPASRADLRVG